MKIKLWLLLAVLVCNNVLLAQDAGLKPTADYGPWKSFKEMPLLEYKIKRGDYDASSKKYEWHVLFRNGNSQTLNFDYALHNPGDTDHLSWGRTTMKAGYAAKSFLELSGGAFKMLSSPDTIEVEVRHMRFGADTGPWLGGN